MTLLLAISSLFLTLQLLVVVVNLFSFPRLELAPPAAVRPRERVSLLVPARNEAVNLTDTLPLMLAQPVSEVLVLDDASDDDTARVVASFAASDARLKLLSGRPLPTGWNGKNWACHQLADAASGELLLFVDADVRLRTGALSAALALFHAARSGLLTLWPRQLTPTLSERLVVPLVDTLLLAALPHPLVRALPFPSLAAGNGQFMLWTREAYRRSGGHAAVRAEVLEDVRLAQRSKAAGVALTLALGGRLVETRMYRSWAGVRDGFAKNILAASGSVPALLTLLLLNTLSYSAAWPLIAVDRRWLAVGLVGVGLRALVCLITRRAPWEGLLQPLAPLALWPIALRAFTRRGGYRWKGREYT